MALLRGEDAVAHNIAAIGDFGFVFSTDDLRQFIKYHLDRYHWCVPESRDSFPGRDWAYAFLERHGDILTQRMCYNISRKRAAVPKEEVRAFFGRLQVALDGIPVGNIISYDETNITD